MILENAKIVQDLRVYQNLGACTETGRKTVERLEKAGQIEPQRTPTGRCFLTYADAERLASALSK